MARVGARCRAYEPAGVVVEPFEAHQQQVGERLGQRSVDVGQPGVEQLLGEECVAGSTAYDREQALAVEGFGAMRVDQVDDVGIVERLELDAAYARQAHPFRQGLAQGVAPVEVVGAITHDDVHGTVESVGQHEADEVPGRGVGPVGVLDHQEQRLVGGERVESGDDRGEQLGALDAVSGRGRGPRQERPESREAGGQLIALAVVDGGECLGERLVGRCAVAEVEAVPGQHAVTGGTRSGAELTQQPGLADAGVAADQHDVASIGVGHAGSLKQLLELADTSDEGRGGRPVVGHVVNHGGLDRQRNDRHTCAVRPTVMLTRRTTTPRRALRVRRGANPVRSRSWRAISDRAKAAARWRLTSRGTKVSGLRIMSPESSYEVDPHIGRVT